MPCVLPRPVASLAVLALLALGGCGEGDGETEGKRGKDTPGVSFDAAIRDAQAVTASDFPRPGARTLQQMAAGLPAVNVGLATSVYTPGRNRLAFGVIDEQRRFVYGKTAVYLARTPGERALGPFPAPADPLVVEPAFRSQTAAKESDAIAAIYETQVDLPRAGRWHVLTLTKAQGRTYGAAATVAVARSSPIPVKGEPAPRTATDTRASAGGDIGAIETRVPPDDMHEKSLTDVLAKRPVALLFATPALCESRVCGPVVDIAAQLKRDYGERVEFLHQEVFVDNEVSKGLRPPLRRFGLRTEPWLFTIDRRGRIAARLEGSFGSSAFREAIEAAL